MGPDGRPREFRSYSLFRIRLIVYRTTRLDSGTFEADRARPHCLAMVHGKRRRRGHGRGTLKAIELSNRFETLFESEIRLDAKYDILQDSRAPPAREQNRLPLSIIHLGLATSQHAAQTTQRNPTSVESKVQPC